MKDKLWICEFSFEKSALDGLALEDLIEELKAFKEDGFTHCGGFVDYNGVDYLSVKRLETNEDAKRRKDQEKTKKETEERKLYAKLKKKYEGV